MSRNGNCGDLECRVADNIAAREAKKREDAARGPWKLVREDNPNLVWRRDLCGWVELKYTRGKKLCSLPPAFYKALAGILLDEHRTREGGE